MEFISGIMRKVTATGLLVALLATMPSPAHAAAGSWHADPESGARVRIPWDDAMVKSARQVQDLILHRNQVEIPAGQRYTSAVYAPGGVPFLVLWTRRDDEPPTRRALRDLAEAGTGLGLTSLEVEPRSLRGRGRVEATGAEGLQARVLFQIARGATVFLGYYYSKEEDAAYFDELASSFELAPGRRLTWEELPSGRPELTELLIAAAGALGLGLTAAFVVALRRKPRLLPPAEPSPAAAAASGDEGLGQQG